LRDVAKVLPLERILIETDSPYLAPVPHRGKENEPAYVVEIAEMIASLRGLEVGEVAAATTRNLEELFKVRIKA
jgi:TatD DNase family protein